MSEAIENTEVKSALEIAKEEVINWLKAKRVGNQKIEEHEDSIKTIAYAIVDGDIVTNENGDLEQTLKWPLEDPQLKKVMLDKLVWHKDRIQMSSISDKQTDKGMGMVTFIAPYIAGLTKQNLGLIKKIDPIDFSIAKEIAGFFL